MWLVIAVDLACGWAAVAIILAFVLGRSIRVADRHRDEELHWGAVSAGVRAPWSTAAQSRTRVRR